MRSFGRALMGVAAALLSSFIIVGTITLSLAEGELPLALAPSPTSVALPTLAPPVDTPKPGQPTFTPSPTIEEPTAVAAVDCQDGWEVYVALPGDTLAEIARFYGITVTRLAKVNQLLQTQTIHVGNQICVPTPTPTPTTTSTPTHTPTPTTPPTTKPPPPKNTGAKCGPYPGWVQAHKVRHGDTLYSLSKTYKTTIPALKFANCLPSDTINVGKNLWVPFAIPPTPKPSATQAPPTNTTQPSNTPPVAPPTNTSTPTATNPPVPTATNPPTPTATNPPPPPTPTNTSPPPPPTNTPTPTLVVLPPKNTPGSGE